MHARAISSCINDHIVVITMISDHISFVAKWSSSRSLERKHGVLWRLSIDLVVYLLSYVAVHLHCLCNANNIWHVRQLFLFGIVLMCILLWLCILKVRIWCYFKDLIGFLIEFHPLLQFYLTSSSFCQIYCSPSHFGFLIITFWRFITTSCWRQSLLHWWTNEIQCCNPIVLNSVSSHNLCCNNSNHFCEIRVYWRCCTVEPQYFSINTPPKVSRVFQRFP